MAKELRTPGAQDKLAETNSEKLIGSEIVHKEKPTLGPEGPVR